MQPKAVLSFVGRFVGITAMCASPMAAQAGEPSTPPQSTSSVHRVPGTPHSQGTASEAGREGDKGKAVAGARRSRSKSNRHHHHGASGAARERDDAATSPEQPEVTTEKVSTKSPPKPSTTPLPTLAAVTAKPLDDGAEPAPRAEPIATTSGARREFEIRAHAVEPRRTPIVRVSTRARGDAAAPSIGHHAKAPCLHPAVEVVRGTEVDSFPLTRCDGTAAPLAVEELSVLVRPGSAARPSATIADLAAKAKREPRDEIAPGIRKIDARLVERIELLVEHFAQPGVTPKLFVVSGYRPSSKGSYHATGRAIDLRLDGVPNTDAIAFCKTLPDTGCGFYPNSSFIHVDVRDSGAGHVSWIDASGSGEKPDYVAAWPPPPKDAEDDPAKLLAKLDELQLLPPPKHEVEEDAVKTASAGENAKREGAKGEAVKAEPVKAEPASLAGKLDDGAN